MNMMIILAAAAAICGTGRDVETVVEDVLRPGRFVYETFTDGKLPADLSKYAIVYLGEGAPDAEGANVFRPERYLGKVKADYAAAGRKLGYADDIGDWVFTDEGKDVKALTEALAKRFQDCRGLDRASAAEKWDTKPLGSAGHLSVPVKFPKKVAWGKTPDRKPGITLVGAAGNAVIVAPIEYGQLADELRWHLKEMSGVELKLVGEIPSGGTPAVVFRAFEGRNDRAVIRREGNAVYVGGTGSGPSHALTYLLESLGIRYLWAGPTGKIIPKRREVVLPDISLDWESPFRVRRMRLYYGGIVKDREGNRDFFRWHGMNDVEGFNENKPNSSDLWEWGHYYSDYYPKYKDIHPEWFALQPDGTRNLHIGIHTERPTFCLSNPELIEQVAREKIAEIRANPQKKAVSLCLPDGATSTWCMCEECRRLDPENSPAMDITLFWPERRKIPYVSYTDRVFTFMNRVAEKIAAECPDTLLSCYAYGGYTKLPVKVKPHPNLLILSVAGNYSSTEDVDDAERNLAGWMSFGNNLIWRPNMNAGFRAPLPQNYARHAFEQVMAMAENGVYGTDFDTMYNEWSHKRLGYFFTAKAHFNPDRLDYDTLLDDYCQAGYGKGWRKIREAYDLLEKWTDEAMALNAVKLDRKKAGFQAREDRWCRPAETIDFDRLERLVAEARELSSAEPDVLRRLERLDFGIYTGRFCAKYRAKGVKPPKQAFAAYERRCLDYLEKDPGAAGLWMLGLKHGDRRSAISLPKREKPEVSWSVMHPTAIDTAYMRRVAAKAMEYGGVDSFEVCGDCHGGYSGVNGLSLLERYPHAHAKIDREKVLKIRRDMNEIVKIAHGVGKPLYYWHREIFIPEGLLEDLPGLLDESGEFDLLGKTYQDFLRYKLDETFKHCPGLDGIVLTLTEADYSVIHNSNPARYPPQEVVRQLVGLFAEEHEKRGKRFILRSFGSNSQDYTDIIGGAKLAAEKHGFEIETKVTEADFVPWLGKNPFLKRNPPLTLGAECDALGEYLSAGYLPAAQIGRIREYVASAREEGADRYTIRIDRVGNNIFDSAHEVNLYAYMRFIADPAATEDGVIREYAAKRFGAAADEMVPLVKDELEMIRNIHYVASNLVFHSFPLRLDMKTVKAGGIFSLYREGASLEATKDIWSILSWMKAPTHAQILAEKEKGVAMSERALAKLEALEAKLPREEYARQHRAFANAVKAAKALRAFTKCCVAYFEEMAAGRDDPGALTTAADEALKTIDSLMRNPGAVFVNTGHFTVVGDDLDLVYMAGLKSYVKTLLAEYRIERSMRAKLETRADVIDFVLPGGIYDDNRTIRTMHGAYSKTLADRVVRYAGNPVFPNGTITVRFNEVPGAKVEVALDPDGAQEYSLSETVQGGIRTVTIGKKGRDYPGLLSVALVRGESR